MAQYLLYTLAGGDNMKRIIFILDEDKKGRELLSYVLLSNNCYVDMATNVKEAKEKIFIYDYDFYFIALDSNIQKKVNIINYIKNIKINPKIIAISSGSSFEVQSKIRSYGITYLLQKPYTEVEIKRLIGVPSNPKNSLNNKNYLHFQEDHNEV